MSMFERLLHYWQKQIGPLSPGFFLEVSQSGTVKLLTVRYNGPGFNNIVQPDGEKPGLEDDSAFLGYVVLDNHNGSETISLVKAFVAKTQQELNNQLVSDRKEDCV